MAAEGLEVWDDKLLPEGLGEQNNVALDTPETGDKRTVSLRGAVFPGEVSWCLCSSFGCSDRCLFLKTVNTVAHLSYGLLLHKTIHHTGFTLFSVIKLAS